MPLATAPLWLAGILLVIVPTALAMMGPVVARKIVGLERLSTNNEVAGFKFATVGVLYAVLLAFVVIVVWEKFSDAEADVSREAGAAATLYRVIGGMDAQSRTAVRDDLTAYLNSAIVDDWKAMETGHSSRLTTQALNALYATALEYRPTDSRGEAILSAVLTQLDKITEARRARLVKAAGSVPGVIWLVLFGGAVLTIGFTFFFGTENLTAQSLMTGVLTMLIMSGLLIIVSIDKPFTGAARVHPDGLLVVIEDLNRARAGGR